MNIHDNQLIVNGIDRAILLLVDKLKNENTAAGLKLITDSIINLIDEREHFIRKRIGAVNK